MTKSAIAHFVIGHYVGSVIHSDFRFRHS